MPTQFTVAIRTFNGAERLPTVLKKLQEQQGTEKIEWEVLIIDNNSQDATAKIIADHQRKWSLPVPFRYVFEPRQGAAFARDRCIAEANSELIGFLDDDNWPGPDWVARAVRR